jgi:hypothetical protein
MYRYENENLGLGIGRFLRHLGDTVEDEQGDALDGQAEAAGDERVRKFMEDDGQEYSDSAGDSHPPMRLMGKVRVTGWKQARGQGSGNEQREQQPARIESGLKAEETKKSGVALGHDRPSWWQSVGLN